MEQVLASTEEDANTAKEELIHRVDSIVSTLNPAIILDGSNADNAPQPKTNPHICNQPYSGIEDFNQDLIDLVATCQWHTRCSAAYCLHTQNGEQKCRFGCPKPIQPAPIIVTNRARIVYKEMMVLSTTASTRYSYQHSMPMWTSLLPLSAQDC